MSLENNIDKITIRQKEIENLLVNSTALIPFELPPAENICCGGSPSLATFTGLKKNERL